MQALGTGNNDMQLAGSGSGVVRIAGQQPSTSDNSNAVATTAVLQSAVQAAAASMTGNRYKLLNVGSGGSFTIPVPAGVLNQMIVEINPNAASIAAISLTLPASTAIPDGFIVHVISTGTVTALALSPNAAQAIDGAPTTLSSSAPFALMWDAGLAQWIRF